MTAIIITLIICCTLLAIVVIANYYNYKEAELNNKPKNRDTVYDAYERFKEEQQKEQIKK